MKNREKTALSSLEPVVLDGGAHCLLTERRLIDRRQMWAENRFRMEMENMKSKRYGDRGRHHWYLLLVMMKTLELALRLTGFFRQGYLNARNLVFKENPLFFPELPAAFDGFRILHLSDLHFNGDLNLTPEIHQLLAGQKVDLCVLTGDFRTRLHGVKKQIIEELQRLLAGIDSRHGFLGVLGNHDDSHMVNSLERIGISMLINSSSILERGAERIRIIGTDDVHYYYTDMALHALEPAEQDFSIALVHSPELFDMAVEMGVDCYLCGHTHGGQVALPGGYAPLRHLDRGRKYYRGNWQFKGMQGYTHSGVGTSGTPVRFNTRGEVVVHILRRSPR